MAVRSYGAGRGEPTLAEHVASLEKAREELPRLITVHGSDDFLRLEAVRILQAAWCKKFPQGEPVVLRAAGEAKPLTYGDVVRELTGGSLFAKDRLMLIRQAERLLFSTSSSKSEDGEEATAPGREKLFVDFLENPSPSIWLIVESSQLPKNRIMGKKLAGLCHLIPCPSLSAAEALRWLRARAENSGKLLDTEAAELLLLAHGADLGTLASELDKLSLFIGDSEDIGTAAVSEFLTGTVEFDIFGLTNAIEERNTAKALSFARKIAVLGSRDQKGKKDDGERSAHRALAMVAGTVQALLRAGVARYEKKAASEFAAAEKLSPWRAEKLLAAAGRFSLRELRGLASMAADGIKRSHDTGGDAKLLLESLAVRLSGGIGVGR